MPTASCNRPWANCPASTPPNSRQLLLRSHDLQYDPTAPMHARLLGSSYQGSHQIYTLELADGTPCRRPCRPGCSMWRGR